jgi:transcription termination factor NusB
MENDRLSKYAKNKLAEFLKNKNLLQKVQDLIVWTNVTDKQEIKNLLMTIFLSTVEVSKLSKTDLDILKTKLYEIRLTPITYPIIQQDKIPLLTDDFIKTKCIGKDKL